MNDDQFIFEQLEYQTKDRPAMFLTTEELQALTGGKRPTTIRRWLDREDIRYAVGLDGWPRVLRSVILVRFGDFRQTTAIHEPRLHLA